MRRTCALAGVALVLAAVPAAASATTVEARDNVFAPRSATVSVGDTVTWKNAGDTAHEVTASAFASGNLAPGASWSWTATKAGTFSYVCRYHESLGMTGTVVVRAASTSHPKTGGDRVALGLLALGASAVAGMSLRYGWSLR
jgi:plastocyanin